MIAAKKKQLFYNSAIMLYERPHIRLAPPTTRTNCAAYTFIRSTYSTKLRSHLR